MTRPSPTFLCKTLQGALDNAVSGVSDVDRTVINVMTGTYETTGQVNQGAYEHGPFAIPASNAWGLAAWTPGFPSSTIGAAPPGRPFFCAWKVHLN